MSPASDRGYELVELISQGGMGTVHLGRLRGPLGFSRLVAIKTLRPDYAANPAARAAFLDEARLTARLRHANVASTLDVVVDGDVVYIVMEYIEGRCLSDLSRTASMSCRRIPIAVACTIIHDVLLGLAHAHEAYDEMEGPLGIVHCDVSPQNVRIGKDGLSRILDFGIARATAGSTTGVHRRPDSELRGKIPYMAPERLQNGSFDHRIDIYACGVLLWEMLTSKRLFAGANKMAVVAKVLTDPVPSPSREVPDVSEALAQVVLRALQRDPNRRFPTARAMADALAAAAPLATRAEVAEIVQSLSKATTPQSGVRAIIPLPPVQESEPRDRSLVLRRRRKTTREKILSMRGLIVLVGILGVILGFGHAWLTARHSAASVAPATTAKLVVPTQGQKNEAVRLLAPKMPRPRPPKK